ncbi:MAG: ATP-binding cassette domain-containing protein [Clostridiales bacterium]|jgi:ABC-2 type transport system ATP-binding protein|nr:ATP-binding cassette domain-containing protein [Clostridiales bacterium]
MGLVVKNLLKKYGDKVVVDNLSFEMRQPGVYALLGTNGAGKTTTIRMILGMLSRNQGEILWKGSPLSTATCNVGYLSEERGLYPKYELMDQLLYFATLRGLSKSEAKSRIMTLAKRLEVEEYLYPGSVTFAKLSTLQGDNSSRGSILGARRSFSRNKVKNMRADQLSKGNQQKIQLMISLISEPELLVLDEPFGGLDPVNVDLFKSIIREEIAKEKYIIMSSHQMAAVEEFCTDITILDRSKAVLQGNLNEIKKSYGRVNLTLKTESDITEYIQRSEMNLLSKKENEYHLKISGEEQANRLLADLISDGVTVITFLLREPSLHEIFVEKAGENHES